jgi:hypothetical protein
MAIDRLRSWTVATSDRAILRRSVVTCLIVGALLTVINHGDELFRGEFDFTMAWQIGLTFLVPFVVATVSGAAAVKSRADVHHDQSARHGGAQSSDLDRGAEPPPFPNSAERRR